MHIDTEGVVLFLHIALAIISFMMAAVLHTALLQMRRAERASDLAVWTGLIRRLEPLLPAAALLLLGSGAWLLHLSDGEFRWSQGWVIVSTVALIVVEALAGALLSPRAAALVAQVSAAQDGPVTHDLRRMILDPVVWYVSHLATVTFLGVVFLMSAKPTGGWAPAVIVAASAIIGLASAMPFVGGREAQRVREPARS